MRTIARLTVLALAATLTLATLTASAKAAKVTTIEAGDYHTCAVTQTGGLKCWGENNDGQLGTGNSDEKMLPTQVKNMRKGVASVDAGSNHTCAVKTNGALFCWGYNGSGQLGDDTYDTRYAPVKVKGIGKVTSVSAGGNHTCAITTSGAAKCWGEGFNGQLGDGAKMSTKLPVQVKGMKKGTTTISAGYYFTCATAAKGVAKCWGSNGNGQLGDNSYDERATPVKVKRLGKVRSVTAGYYQACAVTTKGAAKCWGYRFDGQLGDGSYDSDNQKTPAQVVGMTSGATAMAPNYYFGCGVHGGAAKCWGQNNYGQLGNGETRNRAAPMPVKGGMNKKVVGITTGYYHACGLLKSGIAKCWGQNYKGNLGDGTDTQRETPVKVKI